MLGNNQKQPSRDELRARLRQKQEAARGGKNMNMNLNSMSKKQYNKLQKEVKQQIKQIKEDPRITDDMMLYHKKCLEELKDIEVPSPLELLNNEQLARGKFAQYLANLIKSCKEKNVPKEHFGSIINSTYTQYHVKVFGIDIVPEKLRRFIVSDNANNADNADNADNAEKESPP